MEKPPLGKSLCSQSAQQSQETALNPSPIHFPPHTHLPRALNTLIWSIQKMCVPNIWRVCSSNGTWLDRFLGPFHYSVKVPPAPSLFSIMFKISETCFPAFQSRQSIYLKKQRYTQHFQSHGGQESFFFLSGNQTNLNVYGTEIFFVLFVAGRCPMFPVAGLLFHTGNPQPPHLPLEKINMAENVRMVIIYHIKDEFLYLMK